MTIHYKNGYKYQLVADATFQLPESFRGFTYRGDFLQLTKTGRLILKTGYAWNGPSGPTWDTKSGQQGSVKHDALYQLMVLNAISRSLKEAADFVFYQTLLDDGMHPWRAWYWYKGVQKFGVDATIRNQDIMVAP